MGLQHIQLLLGSTRVGIAESLHFPPSSPPHPTFHWQPQSLEKILLAKQVPSEFKQGFCSLDFRISQWMLQQSLRNQWGSES